MLYIKVNFKDQFHIFLQLLHIITKKIAKFAGQNGR